MGGGFMENNQLQQPVDDHNKTKSFGLIKVAFLVLLIPLVMYVFLVIESVTAQDSLPSKQLISHAFVFARTLGVVMPFAFALSVIFLYRELSIRPVKWRSKAFVTSLVASILFFVPTAYLFGLACAILYSKDFS